MWNNQENAQVANHRSGKAGLREKFKVMKERLLRGSLIKQTKATARHETGLVLTESTGVVNR